MLCRLFKDKKSEILVIFAFILLLSICKFLDISCIIYEVTGIKCPSCNMTRAVFALIKGNVNEYIRLNVMAIPVLVAFLGEIFIKRTFKYKKFFEIYAVIVLVINFVYYINRLFS